MLGLTGLDSVSEVLCEPAGDILERPLHVARNGRVGELAPRNPSMLHLRVLLHHALGALRGSGERGGEIGPLCGIPARPRRGHAQGPWAGLLPVAAKRSVPGCNTARAWAVRALLGAVIPGLDPLFGSLVWIPWRVALLGSSCFMECVTSGGRFLLAFRVRVRVGVGVRARVRARVRVRVS